MVNKAIPISLFLVSLFLFLGTAQAYTFTTYGTTNESLGTSVSCDYNITGYINTTGAKLNYTSYFYSPAYVNTLGFSTRELNAGNCQYMGTFSAAGSGNIENTFNTTPAPVINYIKADYLCDTSAVNHIIRLSNNLTGWKTYRPNTYQIPITATETICDNIDTNDMAMLRATFNNCRSFSGTAGLSPAGTENNSLNSQALTYFYPFHASSSYANISYYILSDAAAATRKIALYVYDMDNTSAVMYNVSRDSSGGFAGLIALNTLAEGHDYVFGLCAAQTQAAAGWFTMPNITVDIYDQTANWNCSAYGECNAENYKSRYCTDLNGIYANKTEISACNLGIIKNATMGFENYTSTAGVSICTHTGWWECTSHQVTNITVDRPTGWSINDPTTYKEYFLSMSSDWATEGTRSLKMWYIPPKINEVVNGSVSGCSNTTQGKAPIVSQIVNNTSMLIKYNVSFPSSYMAISYDVKTCYSPVEQYGAYSHLLGSCPAQCYAPFCNSTVRGRYLFNIINTTSVFGNPIYDDITYWGYDEGVKRRYELFNIVAGTDYTIMFGMNPTTLYDTNGYCVFIDNVQYSELSEPLSTVCTSSCDGLTRIEAQTFNGGCAYSEIPLSPICLPDSLKPYITKGDTHYADTFCYNDIKYYYVNGSGWKSETDAEYCDNWIAEISGDISGFTDEQLNTMLDFAASPLLWAMIISMLLGGIAFYLTKHIEGFLLGFAVGFFLMWSLGFIPTWIVAVIIIIAVLLFAAKFKGVVGGG